MKLTPVIAAAILAYTARAVPIKQPMIHNSNNTRSNQTERTATVVGIGPVPVVVTFNGFLRPEYDFGASSSTGDAPKDSAEYPKYHPINLGGHGPVIPPNGLPSSDHQGRVSFPNITDLKLDEKPSLKMLSSRAAMWKPTEIDNYHEGVKIDIKNSISELQDKLDYLNKSGHLTVDRANKEIDNLSKVIAARLRINFVTNPPAFDEMLSTLQNHVISEIKTRAQDPNINDPLNETQQADQDALLANLHAHYILEGLQEKIVLLAKSHKLTERLGSLSIGQARQMIKNTPSMSDKDSEFCELQLKAIEKAARTMIQKKLVNFPASVVAPIQNPIKSGFKVPGEDLPDKVSETVQEGLNKRESNSQDEPIQNFNSVNDTAVPTATDEHGEVLFWVDYGAPECMKYILDDDLDLEKVDLFEACQAKAAPEISDATENSETEQSTDAIADPEGMLEPRGIKKHMYEIEEDGDEWGRKKLIKETGVERSS
ncbi:hypothetical protein ONS95_012101 [Cadophora gregata]|uniref:uncharacterized protein n=1 Tax=Cadophora gregata TaxID=51156 RepID=UPI0026DC8DFC|nr:uncharacterized protein ONS95_012101 [Cadophora gregata]KAK0117776.1 hypothetical protein ONS95_012101 [Cadophora gregata]KAK0122825.1 hypothetical protein ONS96_009858 [Cadophora gregata f. sp. sojae]